MDPTTIPKGPGQPEKTQGQAQNQPGIYRHRDNGAIFMTRPGEEGILQADAILKPDWRDAWERIGDAPTESELKKMQKEQLIKDTKAEKAAKEAEKAELEAAAAEEEAPAEDSEAPKAKVSKK